MLTEEEYVERYVAQAKRLRRDIIEGDLQYLKGDEVRRLLRLGHAEGQLAGILEDEGILQDLQKPECG